MTFDQLMQKGWQVSSALLSIEDQLREKLMFAETRIFQLERENERLRGCYPAHGPMPGLIAPAVRVKLTADAPKISALPSPPTTRKYVFRAFMGQCFYCNIGLQEHCFTVDHQIPKSKGGRNHRDNLVLACGRCNTTKGDRMPTPAELERAHAIRHAYDTRPPNVEPLGFNPWKADQEKAIEEAMRVKPNPIYTVRNNMP